MDLSRLIGSIPVVLVFVEPLVGPDTDRLVEDLGQRLADFGRSRIQLFVVARVDEATAEVGASWTDGNVRVLADADGALADHYGVTYRSGCSDHRADQHAGRRRCCVGGAARARSSPTLCCTGSKGVAAT